MYVYFECENGHRLKAQTTQAGRGSRCPRCQAPIVIPERAVNPVTDSGIARLLGEHEVAPRPSSAENAHPARDAAGKSASTPAMIVCPRCAASVSANSRSCDQCGLYMTVNAGAWSSVLKTANRYIRARRGA